MEWHHKCILIWGSVLLSLRTTHQASNVATRGTAVQSEDPDSEEPASSAAAPHLVIDQDYSPKSFEKTCTSVPRQNNPWWQVDLGSIYHITAVYVISKGDCCPEQLDGAEIHIGLRNHANNHRCAVITFARGQYKYKFDCEISEARFVRVVLPGNGKTLTLCEVQVLGTILENVAVRGVSFQSSLRWSTAGKASSVIDGNRITTCSITEDKPSQWVKVDLLALYSVKVIQLAFLEDCCYSPDVWVDDTRCLVTSNSSLSLVTLDCGGVAGRYVTVMHPDVPLTLCEVEVYSIWEHPENLYPQRPPPYGYCSTDSCSRDLVLVHDQPKTWFEAQTYCREKYSDLATINNAQDMNKVIDVMGKDANDIWIGLYEDTVTWRWSLSDEGYYGDGEAEFRNWAAGEPTSQGGLQHCAGMQHSGEWKNLDCGSLNIFLCFDGKNAQSRVLVETPMKWADAQNFCRQNHKDLLSVRNLTENQEIQSMVPAGKLAWIGLFGDSWKWSDGSNSIFRYWGQEQLDNPGAGPNCAYFNGKTWSARSCNTKSMFLCHYFKRRIMVRIKTDFDMSDTVIQQQIITQLETKMKTKGISDVKIKWRKSTSQK